MKPISITAPPIQHVRVRAPERDSTPFISQQFIMFAIMLAIVSMALFGPNNQPHFGRGHPHRREARFFRREIRDRKVLNISSVAEEDEAREDLMKKFYGVAKAIRGHTPPSQKQNIFISSSNSLSQLIVAIEKSKNSWIQQKISVTQMDFPTNDSRSCMKLEFETVGTGDRYEASFTKDCKNLHRTIIRWFQSDRDSIKKTPEDDPFYAKGSREYGITFHSSNPAHFVNIHYDYYMHNILGREYLTDLKYENGIVTANKLNDKLELEEMTYDGWKPRLALAMKNYIGYVNKHDRAYAIDQVMQIENSQVKEESIMSRKAILVWRPKENLFQVTDEDYKLIGTIKKQSDMNILTKEENGVKTLAKTCAKFEIKTEYGSGEEKFQVDTNCELMYLDFLKLEK